MHCGWNMSSGTWHLLDVQCLCEIKFLFSHSSMSASNTLDSCQSDHGDALSQQLSVAKTVLLQAVDLLDHYLTCDEQLSVSSQYLSGSTIGAHQP